MGPERRSSQAAPGFDVVDVVVVDEVVVDEVPGFAAFRWADVEPAFDFG
jgi:hypothetical protein